MLVRRDSQELGLLARARSSRKAELLRADYRGFLEGRPLLIARMIQNRRNYVRRAGFVDFWTSINPKVH